MPLRVRAVCRVSARRRDWRGRGIGLFLHDGFQNATARNPGEVGGYGTEFDVARFEHFVQAIDHTDTVADQLGALARQIAAIALFDRWNETGLEQTMLQEVGEPLGVLYIGLAPRHAFDMVRIHEQQREIAFQQVPDRFLELVRSEPVGEAQQFGGGGAEGFNGSHFAPLVVARHANCRVVTAIRSWAAQLSERCPARYSRSRNARLCMACRAISMACFSPCRNASSPQAGLTSVGVPSDAKSAPVRQPRN